MNQPLGEFAHSKATDQVTKGGGRSEPRIPPSSTPCANLAGHWLRSARSILPVIGFVRRDKPPRSLASFGAIDLAGHWLRSARSISTVLGFVRRDRPCRSLASFGATQIAL